MNPTAALVVLALVVAALAVVVGWLVWRSLRGMRAPVAWPAAACELGLTHEPPAVPDVGNPGTLAGGYRGREVLITTERRTGRTARTRIAIDLARPIGAGIALATDGARPALDADDDAPFATGHPTIDKRLAPRAADPARARRLFERKALRDEIGRASCRERVCHRV